MKQKFWLMPKPVIIGLVTYLLLERKKEEGFDKLDLANACCSFYFEILENFKNKAEYIQFDEPFLKLRFVWRSKRNVSICL